MRKVIVILILIGVIGGAFFVFSKLSQAPPQPSKDTSSQAPLDNNLTKPNFMELTSIAFAPGQTIPQKYSCEGANISPPLSLSGVPEEAQSLALIMDDPDAPGGTFVHWLVWNIDPGLSEFAEGTVPSGALEGQNSFGQVRYGGPCPPAGSEHRYFFKVYALDTQLALPAGARKPDLLAAMQGHILAQAELMGIFAR